MSSLWTSKFRPTLSVALFSTASFSTATLEAGSIGYSGAINFSQAVNPSETSKNIDIDMDGDGVADFQLTNILRSDPFGSKEISAAGVQPASLIGTRSGVDAILANPFASGEIIIGTDLIGTTARLASQGKNPSGLWQNGVASYLGLRFENGSGQHVGWAAIQTDLTNPADGASMTLLGYAYQCDSSASIQAGDTGGATGPTACADTSVPEPSTLALAILGAAGIAALRRKRT